MQTSESTSALREAREALGLSQADLGLRVGVTKQAISQFETGSAQPSLVKALAIAHAVGRPVEALFGPPESNGSLDEETGEAASPTATAPSSPSVASIASDLSPAPEPAGKSGESA